MKHFCKDCIFQTEATSIYDFYKKTLKTPDLKYWKLQDFEHKNWLCSNPNICKTDHTNNSLIYALCENINFHGNCIHFLAQNAISIEPSTVELISEKTELKINEEASLSVQITPFTLPAVTETKINEETGEEETVIIEPEYVTKQVLKYKYQWYKNGRKLYKETSDKIVLDTSKESKDEYCCSVTQTLDNNGDGGRKSVTTNTETVIINVSVEDENLPEEAPEDDDTIIEDNGE